MKRAANKQGGFTMVELMVAMVLTTLLIGVMFQVSIVILKSYRQHRDAVAIQRAARSSLDLIADAVRNASAGVPSGQLIDATGCTTDLTGIDVINDTAGPDRLQVITASGGVVSSIREDFSSESGDMEILDGAGLRNGDLIILTNFQQGHVLRIDGDPIDNTDSWTLPIDSICSGVTFTYTRGAMVIRAKVAEFYVEDLDDVPTLWLDPDGEGIEDPEPLAEGVEDLQIAVGVDADGDGGVLDEASTEDEWHYNVVGDEAPPDITVTTWRALRITVVARAAVVDADGDWSRRPEIEDHIGATADDGFRRRTTSTVVEIRNLTGSP